MKRDFTYIDDVVEGIVRVLDRVPTGNPDWSGEQPDPGSSRGPYRVYNIGNHQPVELLKLIETLETCLGRSAVKVFLPMQPGEVLVTYAEVEALTAAVGFRPETEIAAGVGRFVGWYREFYNC